MIRWKSSDIRELKKAVNNFNAKIRRLEKQNKTPVLPEKIKFNELKESIMFRNDLKRTINSLRRFSRRGAEELYTTQAGVKMTRWERRELGIASRVATSKITREIKKISRAEISVGGKRTGQTRVSMGRQELNELEAKKKALQNIENRNKQSLELLKKYQERYTSLGEYKKLSQYKENYLLSLTHNFSHMEGFKELYNEIQNINPEIFYELIRNDEVAVDISFFYDISQMQYAFNRILDAWQIALRTNIYNYEQ